jgi:outer membrane protein OmpA-like peptidoglycan-associated protein
LNTNVPVTGAIVAENAIAYEIESGSLPAGLTLDTWTGKITGTPTALGAYSFTVRARSMYSVFASRTFSGTVTAVEVVKQPDPVVVTPKPLDPVKPEETVKGPAITPVLVNGAPSGIVIIPNTTQNGLLVNASDWSLKLRALDSNGNPVALAPTEHLVVNQGHSVGVDGTGFKPNSDVKVYVFSDPILLGTVKTDAAGSFAATLPIANDFTIGTHTLQVSGYSPKDDVRTASVGLLVKETPKTTAVVEAAAAKRASRVVPFAKAKFKIGTSQAKVIKQLPIKASSIIVVTGYADATSGQDDIRVSLDRALEVKAAILKKYPKAQVTALGGGTRINALCTATKNKCAVVRVIKK